MHLIDVTLANSAGRIEKLPEPTLPEVAFAGRSNVGKSSLLNAICNRKNMFKVSQTPGRTRTIVHAKARLSTGGSIYLVDLPGYGFARVSRAAKQAWAEFVEHYLAKRTTLHLVSLLIDVRRGPEEEELNLLEFLDNSGVPALLVATKIDRLPKSKRRSVLDRWSTEYGPVAATSAKTREGIDALWSRLVSACGYGPLG